MCLYPRQLDNPRYKSNKSNGGNIPPVADMRLLTVEIPCGNCIECRKQRANEWKTRLCEDIRHNTNGHFVTLTFDTPHLIALLTEIQQKDKTVYGYGLDNQVAKLAVKRFRERWRKQTKKSIRHWLVTELGTEGTEHIHLHGFLWTDQPNKIADTWGYGSVHIGTYTNERTVNYCVKYVMKTDTKHRYYKPIILTTPGIGKQYIGTPDSILNRFRGTNTKQHYTTRQGQKTTLPQYYRRKLYTQEELEQLRLHKIDKGTKWILGEEVNLTAQDSTYYRTLRSAQIKNLRLGYGTNRTDQNRKEKENQRRNDIHEDRRRKHLDTKTGK